MNILLVTLHQNKNHFFTGIWQFIKEHLIEITILLFSILLYANALSRSDLPHLQLSFLMVYCYSAYLILNYICPMTIFRGGGHQKIIKVVILTATVMMTSLFLYGIITENMLEKKFPAGVKDCRWIPYEYMKTATFIKNLLTQVRQHIYRYLIKSVIYKKNDFFFITTC